MEAKKISVKCRPAKANDSDDVMELTRTIWEGEDYVPQVWQKWLQDPTGLLAVAEYQGQVIGLGKLTRLAAGQWWLEGLRTHPEYEGHGVASALHAYLVQTWERSGEGTLRLATASFRLAVQHLSERSGFRHLGAFTPYRADALSQETASFRLVSLGELANVTQAFWESPASAWSYGLVDLDWEWAAPQPDLLQPAVAAGRAWWWRENRGALIVNIDDEGSAEATPFVTLLACERADLVDFLLDYRRLAAQLGFSQAGWRAALQPDLQAALEASGFQRTWDGSVYIYAKDHPIRPA